MPLTIYKYVEVCCLNCTGFLTSNMFFFGFDFNKLYLMNDAKSNNHRCNPYYLISFWQDGTHKQNMYDQA